jgi:hypothetical protein
MKRSRIILRSHSKDIKGKWHQEFDQMIKFANAGNMIKINSLRLIRDYGLLVTRCGITASARPQARADPGSPAFAASDQGTTGGVSSAYQSPSRPVNASNGGQQVTSPSFLPYMPDNHLSPPNGTNPGLLRLPEKGLPGSPGAGPSSSLEKPLPPVGLPSNSLPRSRTPEPLKNSASEYPGGFNPYPSKQGHKSDTDLTRNVHSAALRRSNSVASLASVSTIATVKEKLYQTPPCVVCFWRDNTWIPLTTRENCIVEIRLTTANKSCWAIILERSDKMVLNAWIHSTTTIHRETPTDVSISCDMGQRTEYYRINLPHRTEADRLMSCLHRVKNLVPEPAPVQMLTLPTTSYNIPPVPTVNTPQMFVSRSSSLQHANEPPREVEQTTTLVMEARCRVLLQNDYNDWTNLNWGSMQLLLEKPSQRKRIIINSDKAKMKLVDSILWDDGLERVGRTGIAITLKNVDANVRIIYMMQMKDEKTAARAYEIMKAKK